ncbi:hypothetical protein GCM10009727_10260 [Actinomadura napierensis]|uniref:SWIM-type domain-containing protein n=1 Tax=Actinomadura napierensis TaxID=267854 RepID=A0ABP5JW14_9ACTN
MDAERAAGRSGSGGERRSVVRVVRPVRPRKLAKVPFVELAEGRLQGVVSSGSDLARVYVSSIAAGSHDFSCSTNNNRPCGGLGGSSMCKHLRSLVDEAVIQYGLERVARYLKAESGDGDLAGALRGSKASAPAAGVFSRFLRHLSYLEVPGAAEPLPEMHWFPAMGAAN